MAFRIIAGIGAVAGALAGSAALAETGDDGGAKQAFARARALCEADGGRLWGADLCGPILVADPASRRFVANMDGVETPLEREGDIFKGRLPDAVPIANTASKWNGRTWVMLMAPLPQAEPALSILLMHEAWHGIQERIGLASINADQDHLATEDGRLAMRLELRALAAALAAPTPEAHRQALVDALTFRAWRHARFPGSAEAEAAMERHEGIAEYTGRVLSQDPEMAAHLIDHLHRGDSVPAYARAFAYYTGPAYGVLLDRHAQGWRQDAEGRTHLARRLAQAIGEAPAADETAFEASGRRYDIDTLRREEATWAEAQRRQIAVLRGRLVDGPVLVAPVQGANFSFDPNRVTPLPPEGAVYGVIRAATDWGVLEVENGALLSQGWDRLSVAARDAERTAEGMKGEGWVLTLAPGWELVPADRPDDWTIRRIP